MSSGTLEWKNNVVRIFLIYVSLILIRELSLLLMNRASGSLFMYIFLALFILFTQKIEEKHYITAQLGFLDVFYASTLAGLMPRYFSVMILGLTGQLVIGPPQMGILPLLIISSIIEEIFFRACIYSNLRCFLNYKGAYLTTIILYAFFHIPLNSLLNLLLILPIYLFSGILLQEVYLKWGLAPSIITHIVYNIIGVFYVVEFSLASVSIVSLAFIITLLLIRFLA